MKRCPFCKLPLMMNEAGRLACSGCDDPLPGSVEGGSTARSSVSQVLAEPVEVEFIEVGPEPDESLLAPPEDLEIVEVDGRDPIAAARSWRGLWLAVAVLVLALLGGLSYRALFPDSPCRDAAPTGPPRVDEKAPLAAGPHPEQGDATIPRAPRQVGPQARPVGPVDERPATPRADPTAGPGRMRPVSPEQEKPDPFAGLTNEEIVRLVSRSEVKLDKPEGEYTVSELHGDEKVHLTGRIGTLLIAGVNGEATLDASKLQAREVIVEGPINGSCVVKLHAPGGSVTFAGSINGSPKITVQAAGGKVVFARPPGVAGEYCAMNGEPELRVTAREARLAGTLNGGGRLVVTLTPTGVLQFEHISGGVRLQYRKANPKDPDPKLTEGRISGGAKLARID